MDKKYKIGIVPGSFDPITLGHLDIIRRAAELCEEVVVAVMINSEKQYMFTLDERRELAELATEELECVRVVSSDGMLFALANELTADAIIKGVRNRADREYELMMASYNSAHCNAETVLLDADSTLTEVSSTEARRLIESGEGLETILSASVAERIKKKCSK